MRRLFTLFFGVLVGGALVFFGFNYHAVRANEGFLFVPKREATLDGFYVDIREWGVSDWNEHPRLAAALVEHGRSDLVKKSVSGSKSN